VKARLLDWTRLLFMFFVWLVGCGLLIERVLSGAELLNSKVALHLFAIVFFGVVVWRDGARVIRSGAPNREVGGYTPDDAKMLINSDVEESSQRNGATLREKLKRRPVLTTAFFAFALSLPIAFVALEVFAGHRPFAARDVWAILIGEALLVVCLSIAWRRASRLVK